MIKHLAVLVLYVGLISAFQPGLPPWIKPCKVGPDFDECSVKNGKYAMPFIMKGDPKYQVPTMDPLFIPELSVINNFSSVFNLNIILKNIKIMGLNNSNFVSSKYDAQRKRFEWVFDNINLKLISDCKVNGKFIVPIYGNGSAAVTILDLKLLVIIDYKKEKRDCEEYAAVTDLNIKYKMKRMRVSLKNLFNGNKELGMRLNGLLNINRRELNFIVGPGVARGIANYMKQVIGNILKTVPLKEIFLEN